MVNSINQRGYSLVELSISLVVLGLLLGGALVPLQVQFERKEINTTKAYIEQAKEAVLAYALQNKTDADIQIKYFDGGIYDISRGRPYLPCPDVDNDGLEDRMPIVTDVNNLVLSTDLITSGVCQEQKGLLPWKTLGIKGNDVWGNRLVYAVDQSFSNQLFGLDETFRADVFDRRRPPVLNVDQRYDFALRQSKDDTGLIVCDSFIDVSNDGCPNNDLQNILVGVVTPINIILPTRNIPAFSGNTSSSVDGIVDGAAFMVLSHGKNGRGAISREGICRVFPISAHINLIEEINAYYASGHPLLTICPGNTGTPSSTNFWQNIFVKTPISKNIDANINAPDDILIWVGSNELMGYLLRSGAFPIERLQFLPE